MEHEGFADATRATTPTTRILSSFASETSLSAQNSQTRKSLALEGLHALLSLLATWSLL